MVSCLPSSQGGGRQHGPGEINTAKNTRVLRLKHEVGLPNWVIARAVGFPTAGEYAKRAEQAGLAWPLPDDLDEEELYQKLFPEGETSKTAERSQPDWEVMQRELARKGVMLKLLWQEYWQKHPDGYERSQFCEHHHMAALSAFSSLNSTKVLDFLFFLTIMNY